MAIPIPTPSLEEIWRYIRRFYEWVNQKEYDKLVKLQKEARENASLYAFLKWLYPNVPLLRVDGFTFPVAVYRAPKEQQDKIESVLGRPLDTSSPYVSDSVIEQAGTAYLKKLRYSPENPWDDPTYRLTKFEWNKHLTLHCALGSYLQALKTCDVFEFDLLTTFARKKPSQTDFESFYKNLHLLRYLRSLVQDPITDPSYRNAAIAISTVIIFKDVFGDFKAIIKERSKKGVAVHFDLVHVIPSFMFQPITRFYEEEYSVRHNIWREYLEELLNYKELIRPRGKDFYDFFYEDDNLRYLESLEASDLLNLYFTGIAVNVLNFRPEICTLMLIEDPQWFVNQRRGSRVGNLQLKPIEINYEFKRGEELKSAKFKRATIDLSASLTLPAGFMRPQDFVPPGAVALVLGVEVARQKLGIHT